ncbi:histidine phosphatase family protein [Patescibacteria group bacterium]
MIIYLIRHGESASDIDNLYGGNYDDHLTEKGQNQARELADKLTNNEIQIIFSSPFIRAKEMADILKNTFNCDVQIINNIRERNSYGFLTGTSKDKAKDEHHELVEKLKDYHFTMEGGEEYKNFTKRIRNAFNEITASKHERIAIITHGGPIRCLFREVLKFGEFSEDLSDCAVIKLEKNGLNFKIVKMDGATLT